MEYVLAILDRGEIVGVVGADGKVHPHSVKTRTAEGNEVGADGRTIARKGDVVRVPHPLEDPDTHRFDNSNHDLRLGLVRADTNEVVADL